MPSTTQANGSWGQPAANSKIDLPLVRFIDLAYDPHESSKSALQLVLAVRPDWNGHESTIMFERCKEGITNTLLKVVNKKAGASTDDLEKDVMLLRAYGHGTHVLIDREREAENHELLMGHGLAPDLIARFRNGMLYRYIRGTVTSVEDLQRPEVYSAVARRLAEWHATIPCLPGKTIVPTLGDRNGTSDGEVDSHRKENTLLRQRRESIDQSAPGKPSPNLWTVMQKWILALPNETEAQRERQGKLQGELDLLIKELSQRPGLGKNGLVFAHCDLLHGNIIIEPEGAVKSKDMAVSFIDYEYATPSPAAFDICNHFAEWAGFECKAEYLPTKFQRRDFVHHYITSYFALLPGSGKQVDLGVEEKKLMDEIDLYRGLPGFYWGIWALIQSVISDIDFDYASYAEERLDEYWTWRIVSRGQTTPETTLHPREKRWAEE